MGLAYLLVHLPFSDQPCHGSVNMDHTVGWYEIHVPPQMCPKTCFFLWNSSFLTPWKFNIAPENNNPKRTVVFQPSFFRVYVKLQLGNGWTRNPNNVTYPGKGQQDQQAIGGESLQMDWGVPVLDGGRSGGNQDRILYKGKSSGSCFFWF